MLNKLCQSTDARKLHLLLDCSIRAELNLLHVGVIKGFFRDRQVEDRANATLKLLRHCVPLTLIALPHHLLRIIEVVRNAFRGHVEVVYSIPQPCSTCIICRKNIWCFRVIPHPPPLSPVSKRKKNKPASCDFNKATAYPSCQSKQDPRPVPCRLCRTFRLRYAHELY